MSRVWTSAIALAIAAAEICARADQADEPTGLVVGLDGDDLILDVGAIKGARIDDTIELWRTIQIRHPVTGQLVSDRFLIGHLKASQVRASLSLAEASDKLTRTAKVSDIVIFHHVGATASATSATTATPSASATTTTSPQQPDADAAELSALFNALHGASPTTRATQYETFARTHPKSRFAPSLFEEARALKTAETTPTVPVVPDPVVNFKAPERVQIGEPVHIAVELRRDAKGAKLYVTSGDRTTFESFAMSRINDGYYAATIPGDRVRDNLRVFVEGVDADGKWHPSSSAHTVDVVERPAVALGETVLAQAGVWSDFASYNTSALNDWAFQTEGYFGARFRDVGLRAVRTGFGVYRGQSGSLADLNAGLAPRDIGLTYGYVEGEVAFVKFFSMIARAAVGLDEDGIEGGAQAFFRIGSDLGTNLLLGGEVLGGVGIRGIAQLEWSASPRVPVMFRSEVTNQPAGSAHAEGTNVSGSQGDVGVRLIAQVGYRVVPTLTIALRASYQGRTINHAGPGGGAAVSYQW